MRPSARSRAASRGRFRCPPRTRSAAWTSRASTKTNFLFYGGKGGVGKTTCAAARAVAEAGRRDTAGNRRSVLVVSTDPAHSLGDALGVTLAAQPRRIKPGLDAVELDASRAFARWLEEHRGPLREILEHGTWLDHEDVDALLDLSIPGVDELVGLMEIARLAETPSARSSYELVVVDTAPTGHTLRLLAAPDAVAAVAAVLDLLQQEHRMIREQLARVGRPDAADAMIAMLAAQARETAERLHDPRQTAFHWVTLPEELSLAESEDAMAALERAGMRVPEVLVNRVLPDAGPCPVCDRRRADERRVLAAIRRRLGRGRRVRVIPAAIKEPRGVAALARFGTQLVETSRASFDPSTSSGSSRVQSRDDRLRMSAETVRRSSADQRRMSVGTARRSDPDTAASREPSRRSALMVSSSPFDGAQGDPEALEGSKHDLMPPESLDAIKGASLLFFGGKGGVGKTTAAAAAALRLARADASRKVLLLSTDPAHSLADVFKAAVGDTAHAIRGGPRNLLVRELDAAAALAERRTHLESALDEIASAVGAPGITADLDADRGVSVRIAASGIGRELINLAPPGIDELFGILSVVDARADYDVIVVDTAPTGHALRLLEMPDAAREWMQVLLRVLLKYRSLVRPGQLAAELVDVSKSIRELQLLLHDATQTRFIVVTRAAEVPRRETERLLTRLRRLRLSTPAVIFNALTMAPGRCARCRATAAAERRELAALRRPRGCAIIRTPLSAPPPRGVSALERWAGLWVGQGLGTRDAPDP